VPFLDMVPAQFNDVPPPRIGTSLILAKFSADPALYGMVFGGYGINGTVLGDTCFGLIEPCRWHCQQKSATGGGE